MKIVLAALVSLLSLIQVVTGCYLSIDNSSGWVFPIVLGVLTVLLIPALGLEKE